MDPSDGLQHAHACPSIFAICHDPDRIVAAPPKVKNPPELRVAAKALRRFSAVPGEQGVRDQFAGHAARNGSQPEQPELIHRPVALEQGDAGRSRGIDVRVGHRDADQVDQRQGQADRDAGQTRRRALVRRAHDDEQEKAGQHHLGHQRCRQRIAAGRMFAVAVRRETRRRVEAARPLAIRYSTAAAAMAPSTWAAT